MGQGLLALLLPSYSLDYVRVYNFRFPQRPLPELLNFWQEISMDENLRLDQQTAEEEEDEKDEEEEEDGNQKKSAIARFLGFG